MNSDYLNVDIEAARRAGSIMIRNLGQISRDEIVRKQTADFVTRVDKEAEDAI